VTITQVKRRRRRSISVEGAVPLTPAAAAAFEVPTAGVPTYFVASVPDFGAAGWGAAGAAGLAASGFTLPTSGSDMNYPPLFDYSTSDAVLTVQSLLDNFSGH
jgi:hypothetical protein